MRIGARFVALALLLAAACSDPSSTSTHEPQGPLAEHARTTAARHDVPGDLVLAIAVVERGLMLPRVRTIHEHDDIAFAGILELRRGAFDTLKRGAELVGRSELEIQIDTDLGTEAGILVLAELGRETGARNDDWRSWAAAVEKLSGYADEYQKKDYRAEVFRTLREGGSFPARDGEVVVLPSHEDVPIDLTMPPAWPRTLAAPDFPGAIWFETSCSNKCNTTRNQTIDAIVIHDTEGGWHASVATLQNDPGKSVHYIIDEDGSRVGQFIPESYMGWHAGNSCWNNRSIGIEHVGYASKTYDIRLYEKSVELIKNILTRHSIPLDRDHVVGHHQVPNPNTLGQCVAACTLPFEQCKQSVNYGGASGHYDPGPNWQWCQFMEMLGGSCRCNDTTSEFSCTTDGSAMWRCQGGVVEKQACGSPCEVNPSGPDACEAPVVAVDAGTDDADAEDAGAIVDEDAEAPPHEDADAPTGEVPEGTAEPDAMADEPLPWPDANDAAVVGEEVEAPELHAAAVPADGGCCRVAKGASSEGQNRAILGFSLALAALARRRARC